VIANSNAMRIAYVCQEEWLTFTSFTGVQVWPRKARVGALATTTSAIGEK
jgi:hypothetical protein